MELAQLAKEENNGFAFTDDERETYAHFREYPNEANYKRAALSIWRSPIRLRTSSAPVLALRVPDDPRLYLPTPDLTPHQLVLALNPTTLVSVVLGDFDGAFSNHEAPVDVALGFNRHCLGYFSYFESIRHLITGREDLVSDMIWGPYTLGEETERKITFHRKAEAARA